MVANRETMKPLTGKRALVTGASRGVGSALAKALAAAGAEVTLVARSGGELAEVAAEITKAGGRAFTAVADLSLPQPTAEALDQATRALGPIDILVNNAGTAARGPLLETDLAAWDAVMALNVRTCLTTAQRLVPGMIARGWGRVINISSPYARRPSPTLGAYCVSKAALEMLTKAMALEWAGTGVTVNAIGPAQVLTDLTRATSEDPARRALVDSQIPMGRWATPDDLVGALLYVASDASAMMTGQTLYVDGGRLLI